MLKRKNRVNDISARQQIEDQIWSVHGPDENCKCRRQVCQQCRWHIWTCQVMIENAWNAYITTSESRMKNDIKEKLYSDGYSDGYGTAESDADSSIQQYQNHIRQIEAFHKQAQLDKNSIAKRSYQDGFRSGYANGKSEMLSDGSNGAVPSSDLTESKKKLIEDMLEQCRIIAESNPNMAPGVNAVKHRLKKL